MEANLNPIFDEFLGELVRHRVRFLVVGAYAVALHGKPRATRDIDIWVEPSAENAARVVSALTAFGYPAYASVTVQFETLERMIQLGVPPNQIDVMTSVSGVAFADAWKRRVTVDVSGKPIAFLSLVDLRVNKRASGRPKDLFDLALLDELPTVAKKPARKPKAVAPLAKTTPKKKARR